MYTQKIQNLIVSSLKKQYPNINIQSLSKDGLLVQKSPDSIDSDYGSSVALRLAKFVKKSPMDIADILYKYLNDTKPDFIDEIIIINPGYLNFSINKKHISSNIKTLSLNSDTLDNLFNKKNRNIQIEFVSANPTGPLHVGHIRGAVYGSALSKILNYYGYNVKNEYYVNDAGNQIKEFGISILNQMPNIKLKNKINSNEDSYKGTYISDLAHSIQNEISNLENEQEIIGNVTKIGVQKMLDIIKKDLNNLNVNFDNWFHETQLFSDKTLDQVLKLLSDKKLILKKDGATWFLSKKLGDERDNVLIKKDLSHTYFFSDIANHYNKFCIRKFDKVINIWGADHQGHIKRTKLAMESLGVKSENLEIKISQMVTIKKGSENVKISKRSGEYVTLSEIVTEVGSDACRYFFLSRTPDSQLTFDIELAKSQNASNPIYYIQYAHARLNNLIENAKKLNIDLNKISEIHLESDKEISIAKKILEFPEVIEQIAKELEPHHITRYCLELASEFHSYYQSEKIIDEKEIKKTVSKILLSKAILNTVKKCLDLMMISSPKNM
tara:strand:- start:577 stop:2238 length:1662 start_codon:yes stop_codon:yes gene_type:complete